MVLQYSTEWLSNFNWPQDYIQFFFSTMNNVLRTTYTCHYFNKRFLKVKLLEQKVFIHFQFHSHWLCTKVSISLYFITVFFSICNLDKVTGKNAVLSINLHLIINKVKHLFMFIGYLLFLFCVLHILTLYQFFSHWVISFSLSVFGNFLCIRDNSSHKYFLSVSLLIFWLKKFKMLYSQIHCFFYSEWISWFV